MRPLLAIAIAFAGVSGAAAQTVEDRYGPPREPLKLASLGGGPESPGGGAAYDGPLLNWAGKRDLQASTPVEPQAPAPTATLPPLPRPSAAATPERAAPLPTTLYAPAAAAEAPARPIPAPTTAPKVATLAHPPIAPAAPQRRVPAVAAATPTPPRLAPPLDSTPCTGSTASRPTPFRNRLRGPAMS